MKRVSKYHLAGSKAVRLGSIVVAVLLPILLMSCAPVEVEIERADYGWEKLFSKEMALTSIAGLDTSHVWLTARDTRGIEKEYGQEATANPLMVSFSATGIVYYCDGSEWEAQFLVSQQITGLHALDESNVWACGRDGGMYFFDGENWSEFTPDSGWTADESLHLTGVSACRGPEEEGGSTPCAWATGNTEIWYFDGSRWKLEFDCQRPISFMPDAVCAADLDHVWAAGHEYEFVGGRNDRGAIYVRDGGTWKKQFDTRGSSETTRDEILVDISAADEGNAWAVGDRGGVYYYDGSGWSKQWWASVPLVSVDAFDPSHVWAIGGPEESRDSVFFFNGSEWREQFNTNWNKKDPGNETRGDSLSDIEALDIATVWSVGSASAGMGPGAVYVGERQTRISGGGEGG